MLIVPDTLGITNIMGALHNAEAANGWLYSTCVQYGPLPSLLPLSPVPPSAALQPLLM